MKVSLLVATAFSIVLSLSACSKNDTNSDGNGPGNADGLGGRADPAPTTDGGDTGTAPDSTTTTASDKAAGNMIPPPDTSGDTTTTPLATEPSR